MNIEFKKVENKHESITLFCEDKETGHTICITMEPNAFKLLEEYFTKELITKKNSNANSKI